MNLSNTLACEVVICQIFWFWVLFRVLLFKLRLPSGFSESLL